MKLSEWLHKLGILRAGTYSWKGSGKDRPIEAIMDDVYDKEKDLVNKKDVKKMNQSGKKPGNQKVFFWVMLVVGVFMLLLLLSGGFSFWFWLGLALWIGYLVLIRKKFATGAMTFAKTLALGIALVFLSFIFLAFTPSEQENSSGETKGSEAETQEAAQEKTLSKTGVLLAQLKEETGLSFSQIEDDELSWTGKTINLGLNNVSSITLKEASQKDFTKIESFFVNDLGWDHGTMGFTFHPKNGKKEVGYASTSTKPSLQGIMCVIDQNNKDMIIVRCGLGPGG